MSDMRFNIKSGFMHHSRPTGDSQYFAASDVSHIQMSFLKMINISVGHKKITPTCQ